MDRKELTKALEIIERLKGASDAELEKLALLAHERGLVPAAPMSKEEIAGWVAPIKVVDDALDRASKPESGE